MMENLEYFLIILSDIKKFILINFKLILNKELLKLYFFFPKLFLYLF